MPQSENPSAPWGYTPQREGDVSYQAWSRARSERGNAPRLGTVFHGPEGYYEAAAQARRMDGPFNTPIIKRTAIRRRPDGKVMSSKKLIVPLRADGSPPDNDYLTEDMFVGPPKSPGGSRSKSIISAARGERVVQLQIIKGSQEYYLLNANNLMIDGVIYNHWKKAESAATEHLREARVGSLIRIAFRQRAKVFTCYNAVRRVHGEGTSPGSQWEPIRVSVAAITDTFEDDIRLDHRPFVLRPKGKPREIVIGRLDPASPEARPRRTIIARVVKVANKDPEKRIITRRGDKRKKQIKWTTDWEGVKL